MYLTQFMSWDGNFGPKLSQKQWYSIHLKLILDFYFSSERRDEVVRPPADDLASQGSIELDNHAIYSEPDDSQYLYSYIGPENITLQSNRVSHGEDNTACPQGNAFSELDFSCAVCHEYAMANTDRLE